MKVELAHCPRQLCGDWVVARRHVDHLLKRLAVPTIVIKDDDLLGEALPAEPIQVPTTPRKNPGDLPLKK